MCTYNQDNQGGFTLLELLIVIAIIGILSSIAVPNYMRARDRARVTTCVTLLDSVKKGIEEYASNHDEYPPSGSFQTFQEANDVFDGVIKLNFARNTCIEPFDYTSDDRMYRLETGVIQSSRKTSLPVILDTGEIMVDN